MRRRTWLLGAATVGGALLVGWGLMPPRSRLGARSLLPVQAGEVALNGWIKVAGDGQVTLAMHRSEMGQGVHTGLAMLVAEEMDVALDRIRLEQAGHDRIYGNVAMFVAALPFHPRDKEPGHETDGVRLGEHLVAKLARELGINATGGSTTIADAWEPLRLAAATARAQLVGAASLRWKQPREEITVQRGVIAQAASGSSGHFGEFAAAAAATPTGEVRLKPRETWTLIGRPAPRTDVPAKSDGSAVFGIDVRPEGLLYAAVRMCPMLGGAPQRILNEDEVLRRPGVLRLVRLPAMAGLTAGVAVVGRTTWHARQAVDALAIDWAAPPAGTVDSAAIAEALEAQARAAFANDGGLPFHSRGELAAAEREAAAGGARAVEAVYRAPYLAHAALEPINATARVQGGRVEVWASTQVPGMARALAARVAGVPEDAVTVHVSLLGGGFGRRLDADFVAQAVTVAQVTGGRPVQIVWSRAEDMTHDYYRPAAAAVMKAWLGADGKPRTLRIASAGDAITPRWMERGLPWLAGPVDAPDKSTAEGLFDLPYEVPHQRIAHAATRSGVPIGYWRAVGHSHNAFFGEGFVDELAHAAGQDPVAYRLALLVAMPRHAAVLRLAADKAGWGQPLPAGRARGVALHESFGSIVAQVVEVSASPKLVVHRVTCAVDCGTVVNPAIVVRQMESGIVFGLTAALYGRIDIVASEVQQKNYPEQKLLMLAETPVIETLLVPSPHAPTGVGEPGLPPIAPALANALFVLTGVRQRELPLKV